MQLSDSLRLSIGGHARTRLESWENFGFGGKNDDSFMLYRAFLHTDWRIGKHWRIFVEGKYAGLSDRDLPGGKRAALDADQGDFWNAFVEAQYDVGDVNVMGRLGRQELQFGAQRLVSPLDWANNRRIFSGGSLRVAAKDGQWRLDGFVTRPVINDRFDVNKDDSHRLFSGLYLTHKVSEGVRKVDGYVLALNGIDNPKVDEDRYTAGGRFYGKAAGNFSFDVEGAVQFGDIEGADIFAWMLTAEATYSFADITCKPFVTLGVDYASGDDDPTDSDVGTFKHLFPLGHAYLGYIDAIGRQNIVDVRGTVGAWVVPRKVRVKGDIHAFFRADDKDAVYNAGGGVLRPGGASDEEYVGSEFDLTVLYKINRNWTALFGYSHFFAGDFIEESGSDEDIDFFYSQVMCKF